MKARLFAKHSMTECSVDVSVSCSQKEQMADRLDELTACLCAIDNTWTRQYCRVQCFDDTDGGPTGEIVTQVGNPLLREAILSMFYA